MSYNSGTHFMVPGLCVPRQSAARLTGLSAGRAIKIFNYISNTYPMKTTRTLNGWKSRGVLLVMLACTIAVTSCKKSEDGGPGGDAAPGTIKAKIDGASFASLKMTSIANRVNVGGKSIITVQGNESSGKAIVLVMNGVDGPGTYAIGGGANISISASYTEVNIANPTATKIWQAPFDSSVAGEVKIAELTDAAIKGTFTFTAKNTTENSLREITAGAFNMSL